MDGSSRLLLPSEVKVERDVAQEEHYNYKPGFTATQNTVPLPYDRLLPPSHFKVEMGDAHNNGLFGSSPVSRETNVDDYSAMQTHHMPAISLCKWEPETQNTITCSIKSEPNNTLNVMSSIKEDLNFHKYFSDHYNSPVAPSQIISPVPSSYVPHQSSTYTILLPTTSTPVLGTQFAPSQPGQKLHGEQSSYFQPDPNFYQQSSHHQQQQQQVPNGAYPQQMGQQFYTLQAATPNLHIQCSQVPPPQGDQNQPTKCSECLAEFPDHETLKEHATQVHNTLLPEKVEDNDDDSGEKPFKCRLCDKAFFEKAQRSKHVKRIHKKEKIHLCRICQKGTFSKWELQEHERIHTAEKPYVCEVCEMRFRRKDYLTVHTRQHTGVSPYACQYCSEAFKQKASLNKHLKNKHPNRESTPVLPKSSKDAPVSSSAKPPPPLSGPFICERY